MSNKDNLQKSFEKAFENHQEPLNQAQWDRLDAAFLRKKSKFRFLPWILGLFTVAILCTGIGYWFGNANQSNNNLSLQSTQNNSTLTDKSQSINPLNLTENNHQNEFPKNENFNIIEEENIQSIKSFSETKGFSQTKKPDIRSQKNNDFNGIDSKKIEPNNIDANILDNNNAKINTTLIANNETKVIEKPSGNTEDKDSTFNEKPELIDSSVNIASKKDSTKSKQTTTPPPSNNQINGSRFAIGFTTGISHATYKNTSFEKSENMHIDTRSVFENSVKKTSSTFYNLFFEFKIFKNLALSLSSGVQYRELKSEENTNYTLRQIPFRNQDGSIKTYIPDTSQNPLVLMNKSINTTKYISIPLAFSYLVSFKQKNEIQFTAGVIANKLVAASGKTFSLNDFDAVDYKSKLNAKITLGYLGGINYFRQIYRPLWLGFGCQMQQNKLQMNTDYGSIKSNINITNYTFNIKYKF